MHDLTWHVEQQIQLAISGASPILFADVQQEITPLDSEVARLRRWQGRPQQPSACSAVANKTDVEQHSQQAGSLIKPGFGEPLCVSACTVEDGGTTETIMARLGDEAGE
jgi:predicted GTPase